MEQKPNYGPTPSRRVRKVDMNPLRAPAIAASWGTAIVLVTPLCGLWFSCGCDWPWVNFFFVCNAIVNTPIPHCPWCVDSLTAATSIGFSIAASSLAAWKFRPTVSNALVRILYRSGVGTAVFVGALLIAGWLTALATGYPSFLGMRLN